MNHTVQWLLGGLALVLVSLIGYVWIDREQRIATLETRVDIREKAWHDARYTLHDRITQIEHDLAMLKLRCPPGQMPQP